MDIGVLCSQTDAPKIIYIRTGLCPSTVTNRVCTIIFGDFGVSQRTFVDAFLWELLGIKSEFLSSDMRSSTSNKTGLVDPSSPTDSTGSRTSIRTMALVVLAFVLIALFSRFGSGPLSTSTMERINEGSDKVKDPAAGIQQKIHPADCAFLRTLEDTINARRHNILTYWNVSHYPNFLSMMSIPTQSWKIQKAKYMKLLLEANTEHQEKQQGGNSSSSLTFIAGFSGSSVTAGHGKFACNSYCIALCCFWLISSTVD